jgi:TonB family protein
MMELELCLFEHGQHGLVLLTLGQLYLLGGQGDPELLPSEGPAADVGDWSRNRVRLLKRAGELLDEASAERPDDAIVDYLRADVATARGDAKAADSLFALAQLKCTLPRSVATVRQLQRLNRYPAYLLTTLSPEYPRSALEKRITGDVVLDLLISPQGTVHQVTTINSPAESLTRAAAGAARAARYRPAKIGRYPVWSWLQITAKYSLDD